MLWKWRKVSGTEEAVLEKKIDELVKGDNELKEDWVHILSQILSLQDIFPIWGNFVGHVIDGLNSC